MDGIERRLALDLSHDEAEFGFRLAEERLRMRAAVRELRPGLVAVKIRAADGTTEYAICSSSDLRPIYPAAKTLDELRRRFLGR